MYKLSSDIIRTVFIFASSLLTFKTSFCDDCDLITCVLFRDIYLSCQVVGICFFFLFKHFHSLVVLLMLLAFGHGRYD